MNADTILSGPMKIRTTLSKRNDGESEPFEVIEQEAWYEADGTEITDPVRIAELIAAETAEGN